MPSAPSPVPFTLVHITFIHAQTNIPQQPNLTGFAQFLLPPATWGALHNIHEATMAPPSAAEDGAKSEGTAVPFQARVIDTPTVITMRAQF